MQSKRAHSGTKRKAFLALATLATLFFSVATPMTARAEEPKDDQVKLKHKVWKDDKWQAVWLEKFKADDLKVDGEKVKNWSGQLDKSNEAKQIEFVNLFSTPNTDEKKETSQPFKFAQAIVKAALKKRTALGDAKDKEFSDWMTNVGEWLKKENVKKRFGRKADGFVKLIERLVAQLKAKKKADLEAMNDEKILSDIFNQEIKDALKLDPKMDEERPGEEKKDKDDKASALPPPGSTTPPAVPGTTTPSTVPSTTTPPSTAVPPGPVGEDPYALARGKIADWCKQLKDYAARKAAQDQAALDAILKALAQKKNNNKKNNAIDPNQLAQQADEAAAASPASGGSPPPPPSGGGQPEASPAVGDNGQGLGDPQQPGQIPPIPQDIQIQVGQPTPVKRLPIRAQEYELYEEVYQRSDAIVRNVDPNQMYLAFGFYGLPTMDQLKARFAPWQGQQALDALGTMKQQTIGALQTVSAQLQQEQQVIGWLQEDLTDAKKLAKASGDQDVLAAQKQVKAIEEELKQAQAKVEEAKQLGQGGQQQQGAQQVTPQSRQRAQRAAEDFLRRVRTNKEEAEAHLLSVMEQKSLIPDPVKQALKQHRQREAMLTQAKQQLEGNVGQLGTLENSFRAELQQVAAMQQNQGAMIPTVGGGRQFTGQPVNRFGTTGTVPPVPSATSSSVPGNGEFRMQRTSEPGPMQNR